MAQLLDAAGDAFLDKHDPFCTARLVEHDVTADEAAELAQAIGVACYAFILVTNSEVPA